jgi:hypothetical protein
MEFNKKYGDMWYAFPSTAWYRTSIEQTIVKGKLKKKVTFSIYDSTNS